MITGRSNSVSSRASSPPILKEALKSTKFTKLTSEKSDNVRERISKLLDFSKLLCRNLRSVQCDRREILRKTESLSQKLDRNCITIWSGQSSFKDCDLHSGRRHPCYSSCSSCSNRGRIQTLRDQQSVSDLSEEEAMINKEFYNYPLTIRCRGGVDLPDVENDGYLSGKCKCQCTLCSLQAGKSSETEMMNKNPDYDSDTSYNILDDFYSQSFAPAELQRLYAVQKLRENLERVKNRNRTLKKLLKKCNCSVKHLKNSMSSEDEERSLCCEEQEESWENVKGGLIIMLKHLQSKCRMKDGMIAVLASELRNGVTASQARRILRDLAQPGLDELAHDFDRTTLWKYLNMPDDEPGNNYLETYSVTEILICGLLISFIVFFAIFRFRDCVSVKLAFACETAIKCFSSILWNIYKLFTSCEIIIKIPTCICKQVFVIIPFLLTLINEYVFQYIAKYCLTVIQFTSLLENRNLI